MGTRWLGIFALLMLPINAVASWPWSIADRVGLASFAGVTAYYIALALTPSSKENAR